MISGSNVHRSMPLKIRGHAGRAMENSLVAHRSTGAPLPGLHQQPREMPKSTISYSFRVWHCGSLDARRACSWPFVERPIGGALAVTFSLALNTPKKRV
jgi:hypothetical protein